MNNPDGAAWKARIACWKLQSHGETSIKRLVTVSAATIIVAAVLGGCGGGGGGGGPSNAAPDTSYPTLFSSAISANGGVTTNYSKTAHQLTPLGGAVIVNLNAPDQSVSIAANLLGTFDFTVGLAALGTLGNSPLDSCTTCLRAGPTTASDNQIVSFIYLDPSIAGMSYSTLGLWSKPTTPPGPDVGAAFSIGVVTRHQDLPIFGNPPTYNGIMVGRYTNGSNTYAVAANVKAVITFSVSGSSVAFTTTNNTSIAQELPDGTLGPAIPEPALNLTSPIQLTYSGTSTNSVTGNLNATGLMGGGMSGPATAKYYGPPTAPGATPAEFGGAFFVKNLLDTEQLNGSFVLRK